MSQFVYEWLICPESVLQISNPFKNPVSEKGCETLMLLFKSASAFPPFSHSAQSLSRRNMDTTCFRATAHFPPRAQPKSFSIDWILSSGQRKTPLDTRIAYTQPDIVMREAFLPALTNRPFVAAFGSACVYAPHFYHRRDDAFRNIESRLHAGKTILCYTINYRSNCMPSITILLIIPEPAVSLSPIVN